jgi:hypothetical protein
MMKILKIINVNLIALSLWLTPVLSSYAEDGGSNINLIDNNSTEIGEGRFNHQKDQLAKNKAYQNQDNSDKEFMKNASCNQDDEANNPNAQFLGNALANERLEREEDLLEKFSECLFNDMTEANVLAQRNQEVNTTLGPIGEFSGFSVSNNGGSFDAAAYDNLRSEKERLESELATLRTQEGACFPTTTGQPDYCSGATNSTLPPGCENATAYEKIKSKNNRLMMLEGDLLNLEEKKRAAETLANGSNNISEDSRDNLNAGANHLDKMEKWEEAKQELRDANSACGYPAVDRIVNYGPYNDCPTFQSRYQSAHNACYNTHHGGARTPECADDVRQKYGEWQSAKARIITANSEVRMYFNQMARNGGQNGENSEAAARDGGAKAGNTLNSIESNAGAYGPFLDKISAVVAKSNGLYNDAMANLQAAQENLKARKEYTDDYDTFNLMRTDFGEEAVQSTRDVQLLISDIGLMATASSGAQAMKCREIGYNKDTRQIDFRPNCPTNGAGTPLPKNLDARMSNPNATFKQCYVRSFNLFRAASAMYLAAEINAKENMNKIANECLMRCVAMTDTTTLSSLDIDPSKREPNCMVRLDKNDPTSEVAGIYINDGNAQDDKNEQMAALERAANLYGNMVELTQLKSASKQQALDMYNIAWKAAMEEMTAKTQRVSTAQANLDAARAALRATDTALNLIIAAIAAYTAYKLFHQGVCAPPYNIGSCIIAAAMVGVIAIALAYKRKMQKQKQRAQREVAYWMEELKDAQLHGHMACNYPGINKNYKLLSEPSLLQEPTHAAIGISREGSAIANTTLGDAELEGTEAPLFNAAGDCIRYCDSEDITIPPERDLYDAVNGNPDLEWAVNREGDVQNNVAEFDPITGECVRFCEGLDIELPTSSFINNKNRNFTPKAEPFKNPLDLFLEEQQMHAKNYVEEIDGKKFFTTMEEIGFTKLIDTVLLGEAHANNLSIIDNDSINLSSAEHTSEADRDLGLSMGMSGLNNTTDFSYFLAMKVEALKMQTHDATNHPAINLQSNPVEVDGLVTWNGSDCDDDLYNTNIEDGNSTNANGVPTTDDVNNRNAIVGCGPEMHLEDFADFEERNTSTFPTLTYKNELPERTGFPLPETRHVYIMSVVRQIQKNMMLHQYRVGDCWSTGADSGTGKTLASAGSGVDNAPSTVCGMANRYAQLVRYARRQMGLSDVGLDEVALAPEIKANGVCLKFSRFGNPIPDPVCQCRLNNTCVQYNNPTFGNFSTSASSAGSLAVRMANATLEGDLEGAGVAAGELSSQSNAIRRSLRKTKEKFKRAAFKDNEAAAKEFFKKNTSLDPSTPGSFGQTVADLVGPGASKRSRGYGFGDAINAPTSDDKKVAAIDKKTDDGANDAVATTTTPNAKKKGKAKPGKANFYAGGNINLDIDGVELDDDINLDGAVDMSALKAIRAKEDAEKERIARSFASEGLAKKKETSWGDAVHQNPNSSLFKIISRRYRKTAYPRFMKKK